MQVSKRLWRKATSIAPWPSAPKRAALPVKSKGIHYAPLSGALKTLTPFATFTEYFTEKYTY